MILHSVLQRIVIQIIHLIYSYGWSSWYHFCVYAAYEDIHNTTCAYTTSSSLQAGYSNTNAPTRHIRYQALIPYNHSARFTFVGLHDVLCFHLIRFTPREVELILPFLSLHKIRFRNWQQATPEEALAVVLIRLPYPTRYCAMMDRFGHSRTWLSIVFNDTIIHLYQRYRKSLHRTKKGFHLPSCQDILKQFMTWEEDSHSRLLVTQWLTKKSFIQGRKESMALNTSLLRPQMVWYQAWWDLLLAAVEIGKWWSTQV